MKSPRTHMTQQEFGELVGVDRSVVSKAIKAGRIRTVKGKGIPWETELPRWEDEKRRRDGKPAESMLELEAAIKRLKIRKEELVIGELEGKLMDVRTMEERCFNFARLHRDKVLAVPSILYPRISEEVDGKTADLIESIMRVGLEEALEELSGDLSKDSKKSRSGSSKRKQADKKD